MVFTVINKAMYPFFLREVARRFATGESVAGTLWGIAGLFAVTNVNWYFYDRTIMLFEAALMRDLAQRSFTAVQAQSMRFFENSFAGSLVTYARRFRGCSEAIVDAIVYQLGRSCVMIVVTLIVFAWESPLMALIFLAWIILFAGTSIGIAKLRITRDLLAAEKDSVVGGAFADSFSNQSTVKSFGKERDEQNRFNAITEEHYQLLKRAWLFGAWLLRVQGTLALSFELGILALLANGTVTQFDFLFFQAYIIILIGMVWDIGNAMHKVFRNLSDAKEMAEIFAKVPEVRDAANARPLIVDGGEIEFHAINFSYVDQDTREHHDVNQFTWRITPGQTIAFVGHSGAGKSTLVKLLMRYFDVSSGYIRIDRQDIATVTQESLRQQIAVVPQEPNLFHRTLRENIAFGRPDASEEEIIIAAKRAHAWDFIQKLPLGLDTIVGERGLKLSGGQRQRVALARAFLADTPILILDEATSSLDSKTELKIQRAIADLLEGRTCIVIAHRLSTIQRADQIIVMADGFIAEHGTHEELLERDGVYAELWAHQSGGYITD
jgi:ATP-binding cassette subfamily B protein